MGINLARPLRYRYRAGMRKGPEGNSNPLAYFFCFGTRTSWLSE